MEINLAVRLTSPIWLYQSLIITNFLVAGEEHLKFEPAPEGLPNIEGPGCATGASNFSARMIKFSPPFVLDEHPNVQPLCGELPNVDEPGNLAGVADVLTFIKLPEHF
jgi:hypothetical protein